ncbi:PREDICTED: cytochrome P450 2M1-like [Priapulus caudatus]|uniref:Cytochrome P450 2M1-like n=1 Tax=Priapulus caudatus TaxID=37621 RepID=A0ABM1FAU2_PRICU|nr:PREDICTED: cytochrome P450 2M1-like [Priapulus caudatus]
MAVDAVTVNLLLGIVLLLLMHRWATFPGNLPPAPRGLPVVGYLPFLGKHPYMTLPAELMHLHLGKKYGPMFTVWVGPVPMIVLNSYDAIRETYVHRGADFMDRRCNFVQEYLFEPLKIGDQLLREMEDGAATIIESMKAPEGLFPLLRFRPGSRLPGAQKAVKSMKLIIMKLIQEHQDKLDQKNPKDFVNYYLQQAAVDGKTKVDSELPPSRHESFTQDLKNIPETT